MITVGAIPIWKLWYGKWTRSNRRCGRRRRCRRRRRRATRWVGKPNRFRKCAAASGIYIAFTAGARYGMTPIRDLSRDTTKRPAARIVGEGKMNIINTTPGRCCRTHPMRLITEIVENLIQPQPGGVIGSTAAGIFALAKENRLLAGNMKTN
jgi:hypothetical protein